MKVKATLTLTVWYDDTTEMEAAEMLLDLANTAANQGLMTNESTEATVDTWDAEVTTERAD